MAKQVVAGLVGAAIGVMVTTAIAMSVRPDEEPACAECPACPQPPPPPQPPPQQQPPPMALADAGVAEADIDGGPDLGDVTTCHLDEVACLLADQPPPCCTVYGSYQRNVPPTMGLGAPQIRAVVARLRSRIVRCAEESDAHGTVRASVRVAPDGTVASVVVQSAPDDALAQCVAAVMRSARFPASNQGVSFTYPFVF